MERRPEPAVMMRNEQPSDVINDITEIYNDAILTTTAAFDTEPKSVSAQP